MYGLCDVSSEASYDIYSQCVTTKPKEYAMSTVTIGKKFTFDNCPIITMPDGSDYYIKDNKPYKLDAEREAQRKAAWEKHNATMAVREKYLCDLSGVTITWVDDKGKKVQTMTKKAVCLISGDRALGCFEYTKGDTQEVFRAIHQFYISPEGWKRNGKTSGLSNMDVLDIDALIRLQMEIGWV
jgi:hypothetical protein